MKKFIGIMAVLTVIFGITAAANAAQITEAQAKEIALKHAGVTARRVRLRDRRGGRHGPQVLARDPRGRPVPERRPAGTARAGSDRRAEGDTDSAFEGARSEARARARAEARLRRRHAALRGRDFLQLPRVRVRDQRRDRRGSGLGDRLVRGRNEREPALRRLFSYRRDGARFARGAYNRDEGCAEGAVR